MKLWRYQCSPCSHNTENNKR